MTKEERWADLWLNKALTFTEIAEAIGPNMEGEVQASVRQNLRQQLKAKSDEPYIRRNARPIDTDEIKHSPRKAQYPWPIQESENFPTCQSIWRALESPMSIETVARLARRNEVDVRTNAVLMEKMGLIRQRPDGAWERVPQGERA
ncbi:MAG: hypothetical protein ABFD89_09180 [Bryobacteraceae bacterium]